MLAPLLRVSLACFGLSYALALLLELARLRWPGRVPRIAGLAFGALGLFAHTLYLLVNQPTPAAPFGGLLAVAWVLAVFYLYGAVHHANRAWAVFVLPVVLGLVVLALTHAADPSPESDPEAVAWPAAIRFWGAVHGLLLLLAAVGVCVGFLASVMYLVQARRLRDKTNPLGGMKLLSLERLEAMNRRAVNLAFPLLTVGLLLGGVLLRHYDDLADTVFSVKVVGTICLWLVFLVLLYLRYSAHVPGRRLALCTVLAFGLMIVVLAAAHPILQGGDR
ncbi:cytochrome c biogenesis protein CcsA [Fimbriiglobus ruber]|uniref:HemX protein, negative effector of steady-state concentration of glutamyl-tRNA reductase n=1 Tax=Fimbriiglobus ruber TaxID=1908690 RepID=A0A225DFI7_9BACT|nr:cytochrome c biogenesis protein CcsA [Fimbriiglobus ruber]OWK40310.1 HemX protein, negative effector of steady-state concentration of glutamyl-tRNA reductase [Fimbriiglobus ruber]